MKRIAIALCVVVVIALVSGCGAVNTVKSVTDSDAGLKPVAELWPDVPRMDGMAASEMEFPVFGKVLLRTALNATGEGKDSGDWVVFSTRKTPDDVKAFYTNDRMASNGWEPSKNSTCLNGGDQGIPGVGGVCFFEKIETTKRTELMILSAQDDKTQETSVFFVRVESLETPVANNSAGATALPKPTRGAITMLNGPAPYGIEKRPMPTGANLEQLLPKQVGPYTRTSMEAASNQGSPAKGVSMDGDSIYAHYTAGGKDIFVEFSLTSSAENAQAILDTAATETTDQFPTDPRFGSLGTEPSYLKVNNEYGSFFAWTRGGYLYFGERKSGEADLDAFMQAFP